MHRLSFFLVYILKYINRHLLSLLFSNSPVITILNLWYSLSIEFLFCRIYTFCNSHECQHYAIYWIFIFLLWSSSSLPVNNIQSIYCIILVLTYSLSYNRRCWYQAETQSIVLEQFLFCINHNHFWVDSSSNGIYIY